MADNSGRININKSWGYNVQQGEYTLYCITYLN